MYFKQIVVPGMGCMSYLIGCPKAKAACVVDPKRDVQDYIDLARQNEMRITHVFETHVHADHVSGNMELKSRTGADIYYMEGSPVTFDHKEVKEGDVIELGNAKLQFMKTPGHTPHAMSILVTDRSRSEEPWLVLTGDCLFVGDVGRPDLAGAELLEEQVKNLYNSLYNKLGRLPESLEVFPAHGEGSLCGKGMSSKPSSTIGFEKRNSPVLRLSEQEFHDQLTRGFPERPKSFHHIIATNKKGPPLLERCPIVRDMSPLQVREEVDRGALILDVRDTAAFGGVHIPGSINIGLSGQTANWIGMVIDPEAELILVVPDEKAYEAMCTQLHRIGYDRIIGYLSGGIASWQEMGYPIRHLWQISAATLKEQIETGDFKHLVDVRTQAEWDAGHIREAVHYPLTELLKQAPDFPRDEEIIVTCGMGYRGNIAASFLQGQGFQHVHSLAGGMKAWNNAGYPVVPGP
ncbi:MAG: MBL fold metallo-hydrolase [Deltaproteobacteria bacterium]|nr:MBL fold metallo-hydrolase [Deltaproteobacteria bacterium]